MSLEYEKRVGGKINSLHVLSNPAFLLGCFISFRLLAFFYWLVLKVRTILFSFTESLLNLRH